METFINVSLIIHITAGCLALLAGLLAIIFRNDTRTHRPFGKVYFWCMTIIFITAMYISVYRKNIFLFCVAFFTYYACLTAFRSLKLKNIHKGQKPKTIDWIIEIVFGTMHVAFVAFGIYLLNDQNKEFGVICTVFGVLGLRGNYLSIKRLRGYIDYSNYWLLVHLGGMLGSYIGAITAFLVNNNRWIHMPNLIAWLGPTVLLVPLIIYEIKRVKKKGRFLR
jgi:hypothetical protein